MNIFILLQLTTLVFRVDRNLAIPEILECNSLRGAIANVASRDEHVKEHACGVSSRYRITTCVRQVLRVLAATVIALAGVAFGVFVGQLRALRLHDGGRAIIFAGNQLDVRLLAPVFPRNGGEDFGVGFFEGICKVEHGSSGVQVPRKKRLLPELPRRAAQRPAVAAGRYAPRWLRRCWPPATSAPVARPLSPVAYPHQCSVQACFWNNQTFLHGAFFWPGAMTTPAARPVASLPDASAALAELAE